MKIEDLTIGQAREIAALFGTSLATPAGQATSPFIGKYVLVRTFSAGVHVGILEAKDGMNVLLSSARRIWKWDGAFTLSEISVSGIKKAGSRVSVAVPKIELTQAVEILGISDKAKAAIDVCGE